MRKVLVIVLLSLILAADIIFCYIRGCDRRNFTDREMYGTACLMYSEHLFEFAIDSTLFMPVAINDIDDSTRIYRWAAVIPNGDTTGVEVTFTRSRNIEPVLTVFGPTRALLAIVGTKYSKKNLYGGWDIAPPDEL